MSHAFLPERSDTLTAVEDVNARNADRRFVPALVVSTAFHIALIVLLSLVIVGSDYNGRPVSTLMMFEEAEFSLTETPTFELEPPTASPEISPAESEPAYGIAIDLSAPPKLEAKSRSETAETVAHREDLQPASATEAVAGISQVALSIQKRVSQAGGKKGEVQFALAWKNINDVDLHVIAPSGERISHLHKRSQCNGMLDVDMNVRGESDEPVENVRWITNAPWGRYTVLVNLFRIHRAEPGSRVFRGSEFQLLAQLGERSRVEDDIVRRGHQLAVFRFQYVPDTLPAVERERFLAQLQQLQAEEEVRANELLDLAVETKAERQRNVFLNNLIIQFPHTDAAIEAMQMLGGNITKG